MSSIKTKSELKEELDDLRSKSGEYRSTSIMYCNEITSLKIINESHRARNDKLSAENDKLSAENDKLRAENDELMKTNSLEHRAKVLVDLRDSRKLAVDLQKRLDGLLFGYKCIQIAAECCDANYDLISIPTAEEFAEHVEDWSAEELAKHPCIVPELILDKNEEGEIKYGVEMITECDRSMIEKLCSKLYYGRKNDPIVRNMRIKLDAIACPPKVSAVKTQIEDRVGIQKYIGKMCNDEYGQSSLTMKTATRLVIMLILEWYENRVRITEDAINDYIAAQFNLNHDEGSMLFGVAEGLRLKDAGVKMLNDDDSDEEDL